MPHTYMQLISLLHISRHYYAWTVLLKSRVLHFFKLVDKKKYIFWIDLHTSSGGKMGRYGLGIHGLDPKLPIYIPFIIYMGTHTHITHINFTHPFIHIDPFIIKKLPYMISYIFIYYNHVLSPFYMYSFFRFSFNFFFGLTSG